MLKKKSPAPEEAGLTDFACANKQAVIDSLQEFRGGVKTRGEVDR